MSHAERKSVPQFVIDEQIEKKFSETYQRLERDWEYILERTLLDVTEKLAKQIDKIAHSPSMKEEKQSNVKYDIFAGGDLPGKVHDLLGTTVASNIESGKFEFWQLNDIENPMEKNETYTIILTKQ